MISLEFLLNPKRTDDEEIFSILDKDHSFYLETPHARNYPQDSPSTKYTSEEAALIIQKAWHRYFDKKTYTGIKEILYQFTRGDPIKLLQRKSAIEANLFEKSHGNVLTFRLAGEMFPPVIVYKVFTVQHVVNVLHKSVSEESQDSCTKTKSRKRSSKKPNTEWKLFYEYQQNSKCPERTLPKKCSFKFDHERRRKKRSCIKWIRRKYGDC